MKHLYYLLLIILMNTLSSCGKNGDTPVIDSGGDEITEWSPLADEVTDDFIANYWNSTEAYFNYSNQGNNEFHYWPQAHALDLLLDAYQRTNSSFYLGYVNNWFTGVKSKNGSSWINDYYDDMEWNALALLRAYEITGDPKFKEAVDILWEDIKKGWNEQAGGGLMWVKSNPHGKNAISNSPAAILAARLYQIDNEASDLEWALKLYTWVKNTLVDPTNGAVWDHVTDNNGELAIKKDWVFTYNQGVYLGAALELYEVTGETVYLYDAQKAADYTLNALSTADRLLKDEGNGDGGLFKGIFVRYLTQMILNKDLAQNVRDKYLIFLKHNAEVLWLEGRDERNNLFGSYWQSKPGSSVDLTVQLSGAMLFETLALLEKDGIIKN